MTPELNHNSISIATEAPTKGTTPVWAAQMFAEGKTHEICVEGPNGELYVFERPPDQDVKVGHRAAHALGFLVINEDRVPQEIELRKRTWAGKLIDYLHDKREGESKTFFRHPTSPHI